jgi:hypothetical protein
LAKCRALAAERRLDVMTVQVDLADYPIEEGRWAAIVSIFGHLPKPLRTRIHGAMVRGLRPGGVIVMEAFTPAQLKRDTGGPPVKELLYPLKELRRDFGSLRLVTARQLVREIHEGPYHDGRVSVAQILAVRPD